jgi:hypothetical protein
MRQMRSSGLPGARTMRSKPKWLRACAICVAVRWRSTRVLVRSSRSSRLVWRCSTWASTALRTDSSRWSGDQGLRMYW